MPLHLGLLLDELLAVEFKAETNEKEIHTHTKLQQEEQHGKQSSITLEFNGKLALFVVVTGNRRLMRMENLHAFSSSSLLFSLFP